MHNSMQNRRPKGASTKPLPVKMRVKKLHVQGASVNKIAKIEKIARPTVTKIIREPDVQKYVEDLRAQWYGLGELALAAEKHQLETKKDGHLGHKILEGMGVVPKKDQKTVDNGSLVGMTEEAGYSRQAIMISNVLMEAHEQMGLDLPDGALERMAEGKAPAEEEAEKEKKAKE